MSVKKETLKENMNNDIFIETGTYKGHTTKCASDMGYSKVYTIELQDRLYDESSLLLKNYIDSGKIEILKGSSSDMLPVVMGKINSPATILLDAHIDGGNFIQGITPNINWCPLYSELETIRNHHIKTHTILIDDIRILGKIGWGKEVAIDEIIRMVKSINPDYNITYADGEVENDVLIAKI